MGVYNTRTDVDALRNIWLFLCSVEVIVLGFMSIISSMRGLYAVGHWRANTITYIGTLESTK